MSLGRGTAAKASRVCADGGEILFNMFILFSKVKRKSLKQRSSLQPGTLGFMGNVVLICGLMMVFDRDY